MGNLKVKLQQKILTYTRTSKNLLLKIMREAVKKIHHRTPKDKEKNHKIIILNHLTREKKFLIHQKNSMNQGCKDKLISNIKMMKK